MSKRVVSRAVLILAALASGAPVADAGNYFWPQHAPLDVVLHHDFRQRRSDDGVLPRALLYGQDGPTEIPTADDRAHRPQGGRTVAFSRPTWNGMRLDWCVQPRAGCGPWAAQSFCEAHGFRRVVQAVQEAEVGRYAHTSQIGTGLACAGSGCHGFARIVCTRE
jgi:hypothetical protein